MVFQFRFNLLKKPPLGLNTVGVVALTILSRLRPKQTGHPPRSKRSMEVNVNQKPAYRHRLVHGYRPGQGVRVLTRAGDSGPAAKAEVFHLVLDIGVKCDVDDEGDEGDEGGNERDEGCE